LSLVAALLSSDLQMYRSESKHQEFLEWLDLSFAVLFALQVSNGRLCSEAVLYLQEDMTSLGAEKCGGCQCSFLSQVSHRLCCSFDQKRSC